MPPRPPIRYVPEDEPLPATAAVESEETGAHGSRWGTYVLGVLLVCTVLLTLAVGGILGWRMYETHQEFADLRRQVLAFPLDATDAERAIFEARLTAARSRLNTRQWQSLRQAWAERKVGGTEADRTQTTPPPAQVPSP
jgi:hypothetical protein